MTPELLIALTIGLPWLGAIVVLLPTDKRPAAQHALAVAFSLAAGLAAVLLLPYAGAEHPPALSIPISGAAGAFGDFTFVADGLAAFLAVVATVIGSLAVIFSIDYMKGEGQLGRYYAFVLLFIGAMAGLVMTSSLLLLFVFWEITALCSYALISFHNDDPKAVRGGIKALLVTGLGGIGLFVGALVAYAYLGTYDIATFIAQGRVALPAATFGVLAFGFLVAGAAKSAQFPFQTWLPDAMEAPTPISALIHAATMVNAGVYLLARFYPAFVEVDGWAQAVAVVGLISALMAAVMALVANDLKRVLAYSTVSQLGYMVYAIGVGGLFASQFHLFSHAIFKALLFLGAGAVIHAVATRDMREMGGLAKNMPFVAVVFSIGALALAGIPPVWNGFWSKEMILEAGELAHGMEWAYYLMVLGAGITALYTCRMVWMVFFGEPRGHGHAHDAPAAMRISLGVLAIGTVTSWLLVGNFGALLRGALEQFNAEVHIPAGMDALAQVAQAPGTLVALVVIAAGIAIWLIRPIFGPVVYSLGWLRQMAADSFGFEWLNAQIVHVTQESAEGLRVTQTGLLNWNVFGIVAGLVAVLAIVLLGA